MKCIKTITDSDFGIKSVPMKELKQRFGARGIVFNDNQEIAILYMKNKNAYKLIGGGIENNEQPVEAFKREVLEEIGYKIKIDEYLGTIDEIKSHINFKQTSYVYVSHIIENIGHTNFTKEEIDGGAEILWIEIDDAINLIKNCEKQLNTLCLEDAVHLRFIVRRDYEILNYYRNILADSKAKKLNR